MLKNGIFWRICKILIFNFILCSMKYKNQLKVHFIGVGGAGMNVLAKLLLNKNFSVSGSDTHKNKSIDELIELGLSFNLGHDKNAIENKDIIIYSSAINKDNVELLYATELKKAICSRAELLSIAIKSYKKSVGISGSHGKTTATCMLANVLNSSNVSITSLMGGEDTTLGSFLYSPKNDIIVSEICEYLKNIKYVSTSLAVCLNIDNDHLDCYGDIESLKEEFYSYLSRAKYKVICVDDKYLKDYKAKNTITYSIENDANYTAKNLRSNLGKYSFDLYFKGKFIKSFTLNVYGKCNVYNALAVIAVCNGYFKLDFDVIYKGLYNFKGVKRRFEEIKCKRNKNIIADYAHHPSEIKNTLETAREIFSDNFLVVFQPHTYSRTKLLYSNFVEVLSNYKVIIYKEYPAREEYDNLGSAKRLSDGIKGSLYYEDFSELIKNLKKSKKKNVLILGAGDLYDKIKNADI